jgi:ectoine hydroxylase-related dioxygenase (phytanoyl-CoA dioxygenase family)
LDRHGGVSIWIALDDLEPESGTLQFVEGSHRFGSLGRDEVHRTDYDHLKTTSEAEGWAATQGLPMRAGDATIHHDLTVHGAGVNHSDRSRIAVTSYIFPAHALYNGAPHPQTEPLGIDLNKPFPPEFFPLLPH